MFQNIKIETITLADWKNKMTNSAEPPSLDKLASSQLSNFLLPIEIDHIEDDDARPNRIIALRALIKFAQDTITNNSLTPTDGPKFLIHVMGKLASLVANRGVASLRVHSQKAQVMEGYYARQFEFNGITWDVGTVLTSCNRMYSELKGIPVNPKAPPNWLGSFSIILKSSHFLRDILSGKNKIPKLVLISTLDASILCKKLFFKVDIDGISYYTFGTLGNHPSIVGMYVATLTDVWSDGITSPSINVNVHALSSAVTMTGIIGTVVVTVVGELDCSTMWYYSDNFPQAGALPTGEYQAEYYFAQWWMRNIKSRQATLQKVPQERKRSIMDSFNTHAYSYMSSILFPAMLKSASESLFHCDPSKWFDLAEDVAKEGTTFATLLLTLSTTTTTGVQLDFSRVRSAITLIGLSNSINSTSLSNYGQWRKSCRTSDQDPRPTEDVLKVSMIVNKYLSSDERNKNLAFSVVRTCPSYAARCATKTDWENSLLPTPEELAECDDLYNLEQLVSYIKGSLFGMKEDFTPFVDPDIEERLRNIAIQPDDEEEETAQAPSSSSGATARQRKPSGGYATTMGSFRQDVLDPLMDLTPLEHTISVPDDLYEDYLAKEPKLFIKWATDNKKVNPAMTYRELLDYLERSTKRTKPDALHFAFESYIFFNKQNKSLRKSPAKTKNK